MRFKRLSRFVSRVAQELGVEPAPMDRRLVCTQLEDRTLLSAAPLDPAMAAPLAENVDAATAAPDPSADTTAAPDTAPDTATADPNDAPLSGGSSDMVAAKKEIVFLDSSAANYEQLAALLSDKANADPNLTVVLLDDSMDGIQKVSETLDEYHDLSTIHFLTSGADGAVKLGNQWLTADSLAGRAGEIALWHNALQPSGDLMFYGCDVGATDAGAELLAGIAALTGDGVGAGTNVFSTADTVQATPVNVILIDQNLDDVETLARAAQPGDQIVLYDGFQQSAADVLSDLVLWAESTNSQINSLSILSHGSAGTFALGSDWVTSTNLDQTAAAWRQLGQVLYAGATIDLYGCSVADGDGQQLLDRLAELTGAEVYASTDVTGVSGDWELEVGSFGIGAASAARHSESLDLRAFAEYSANLAPPTVTATASALSFTQNQSAVVIDSAITITGGAANDIGATVSIYSNFTSGEDVLAFTNQNGITGSWNATTGVLTLSGTATRAAYQTALQSITYVNTNTTNPNTATRTIAFGVTGSDNATGYAGRDIIVTPVVGVPAAQEASGVTPLVFSAAKGNAITITDFYGGTGSQQITLSVSHGTLTLASTAGLTFTSGSNGSATMTVSGTVAAINTALNGMSYTVTPFYSGADSISISTVGVSGTRTATGSVAITDAAFGTPYIITGSYTGNGTDSRNITGIGFQPDVVLIKARSADIGVIRTSSMTGDVSKDMTGATTMGANLIQSLLSDGFQIGTDASVNTNGVVYDYIVFKASAGFLTVGSYSGNGLDNRAITGLGMSPDALFVMDGANQEAVFSTTADEGDTYNFNNGNAGTNHIQSLDGDGFTLGDDNRVNQSGHTYYYIAWNEMAGAMDVGTYTGTGVDNKNISGVGFQAEWLMVQSEGKDTVAHFDSQGASTDTSSFLDGTASTTNRIQALQSDGFQVGSDADVNSNGTTYQYLAFKQQTAPTVSSISNQTILEDGTTGAIAFTIGDAETSASNLSLRVTSSNTTLVPSGNLVLGGSGSNRTLTVTPAANQNGTVTITVDVTDGLTITTRTFTVTVTAVNDQPVRTAGTVANLTVLEDSGTTSLGLSGLVYSTGGGSDESGQTLTYTVTAVPAASLGSIVLADGTTVVTASTTYTLAQIQGMQFTTATNANGGPATFSWSVQDYGGTANGGVDTLSQSLTVSVTAVNDQPVQTAGTVSNLTVLEDSGTTTLGLGGLTYGTGGGSDESGQTFTYTVTAVPAASLGSIVLADGTTVVTASTTYTLAQFQGMQFKTATNANGGPATFSWTVTDSGGTANGGVNTLSQSLTVSVTAVNDQPIRSAGNPAAISVNEDSANTTAVTLGMSGLTYGVGGGADEAAQTLTYTLTAIPSCVTLWLADGTTQVTANTTLSLAQLQGLQYKTVANAVGSGNLTWTVQDNGGMANGGVDLLTETLSVTVGAVNDQPVRTAGNPAAISVNEDSSNTTAVTLGMSALTYGVGGGADEAAQTLSYTVTAIPSCITVWLADGTTQVTANTTLSLAQLQGLKYKTVASTVGSGNLTWTVQDNGGTANGGVDLLTETLSITVGAVNDQPVRTAGSPAAVSVNEDSANTTAVTLGMTALTYGVGGGADEAAQTLSYTVTAIPSCITVWLADGTTQVTANTTLSLAQLQGLKYKTVANAVGSGNLTWTVQDSGGTANGGVDLVTETLAITVGAVNDQPVRTAGNPAAVSVNEDSANTTAVSLGMSALTYGVGGGADEAQTLTYTVTAIPSCITVWLADGTTQVTANTTLSLAELQGLKYKTVANAVGSGNLTWTVQDSGGTANGGVDLLTETLAITVGAVNDQPVRTAGNPSAVSVNEDSANTTGVTLGMSALTYGVGGGADEAAQTLTYTVTAIPSCITVWLADGTTQVTANTTLSLAQLQGLQYKTVSNSVGTGNLTWTVQDNGGTANGGVDLLTETLSITVGAVNDQPVRTAGSPAAVSVNEDSANTTAVTLGMSALTYGVGSGADEAAQTLTYTVTAVPSCVTVWLADGTTQVTANTTLSLAQLQGLKYKTVADAVGSGNLTWTIQDSGGTANGGVDLLTETLAITVGSVNDQPVRTAGSVANLTVAEDSGTTSLGLGSLAYGPGAGESSQTLTYTVTAVPSASLGSIVLADGTTVVTANTSYSLAQLQGMQFKTALNANGGPATFAWTIQDDGGTANGGVDLLAESLSITVTAVNDAPVNSVPGAQSTLQDTPLVFSSANGNLPSISDVDAGSSLLSVTLSVAHGTLTLGGTTGLTFTSGANGGATMTFTGTTAAINGALAGLTYAPIQYFNGTDVLTIVTDDQGNTGSGGALTDTDTVTIAVGAVNHAPVRSAGTVANLTVLEDSGTTSLGLGSLAYSPGAGEPSQTLTYTVTAVPAASLGSIVLADGTTVVTANTSYTLAQIAGMQFKTAVNANSGPATFSWTVQDDGGTANGGVDLLTETLSITVGAVNDQPVRTAGNPAAVSVSEDSANTTAVTLGMNTLTYGVGGGVDEAAQTLTYTVTAIPSCITVWLADGTTQVTANTTLSLAQLQGLKYKTDANAVGSGSLTWTVQDNGGTANGGVDLLTETLAITVGAVNDQPVRTAGNPAAISVNEDSSNTTAVTLGMNALTYGVGGGADEASQTLTYTVTAIPSCITVWLADGTTQVTANTTLSLAQLQGLQYKTVANAVGSGNLTWTVQDDGGTANGGVDLLTETLAVTVGAVNDQPVRTAGNPAAISVNEDSANTTAVTLGMNTLTYGVGGGADEAAQSLSYTVTAIPSCITVWLADGTTQVTANTTLSLAQLQGLQYKTVANAVGSGNLTWTVQDNGGTANGGVDLLTETLAITVGAVNDQPVRTAGNPAAISVNEDSANTTAVSLGMSALSYGVGGEADEAAQTLSYTVTAIPSCITVWLADGTTQVTANTTLSLAQLQGLHYKTVTNAVGSGNLTWTVQDDGGTANGGVDLLTETLAITVGAVNDQPVRTAGSPAAVSVNEDSANTTAVTLGMNTLTYGVGGGADEAAQTLSYTVTAIPSCITVWLADGTTQVTANTTLSLAQLQGLTYKTVANAIGSGNLTWTVQDNGGTANGGVDLLTETLSITVNAMNDQPVRTAGNPAAISVNEDSSNMTAVTLGMSALTYGVGGGADEAAQTLTYTVTAIPSCITVWLADGTTQVTANTTLSLAQLQGLTYKTVANAIGSGNLTWTVQDNGGTANGGVDLLTETLAITVGAVNDQPIRTAGNPAAINVNEDSANTTAVTLGMNALTYGVGGGADEAAQTLTYTVTAIPSCVTVWLADGTTQVTANTTLSLAQLQGLKYKTVANAVGSGNLTWTVQDNGGTANGGVDLLTETLAITVGAVNDQPVRTAGSPAAVSVNEDSANSTAVTLGMSGLTYGVGGGADEAAQTLTYTVTAIPSCVTVWLADGTTQVTANTTLSLAQLQGLKYKTVADTMGTGNLTWTVQDNGGTANSGVDLLTETLSVTVGAVNDQPIRTAGNPAAINVNEDSANSTAVTLGMNALTYGVGGGADEASQTLTYTVTAIPSCVTLWLADGTTQVTANTTLSLAQLQGLKYKTVADTVGSGNLTWTVQDNGGTATGGVDLLTETLAITVGAVNDQPIRTAGNPSAVSVDEDSANTTAVTLGMSGLTYGVGGGADEAAQTLSYTVTAIPSCITVWLADGTTQVTANTTLSLAQLQGLKYKTIADTVGSGNLTWTVQDDGGTANGGVDLLTETLAITVGAVNDQPIRTAGNPSAVSVNEDSANTTAVTLGMNALTYGVGGGADEASQTLTYTVTAIPSCVTVWLADGTTQVTANTTLSLAQLQGLKYKTVADTVGSGNLTWTVQDNGGTANGGVDLLTETLAITVGAVNDQPIRTAGNPSAVSVNEDSANTTAVTLGMNALTYGVGGGADEASQTLTYTVTAIPSCVTLWLADGTTQVTANTTLSLAQLQGLTYKTAVNAVGSGSLTWTVQDDGGTANGGADLLTETLAITVGAVNDQPVRTAGNPAAISVNEDSANSTAVTLGMSALSYGVGGGADEASQALTYTVTGIPSFITLWLDDGTTQITANTTLSLTQLQGLKYKTVADAVGNGNLTWTVQDDGGTANGGVNTLTESLNVTVIAVQNTTVTVNAPGPQVATSIGITFAAASGNSILVACSDPSMPLTLGIAAANGAVTLGGFSGLTFLSGDGIEDTSLVIRGTPAQLNAALEGLWFRADSLYGNLTIQISDAYGDVAGSSIAITQTPLVTYGNSSTSLSLESATLDAARSNPVSTALDSLQSAADVAVDDAAPSSAAIPPISSVADEETIAVATHFGNTTARLEETLQVTTSEVPIPVPLDQNRPTNSFQEYEPTSFETSTTSRVHVENSPSQPQELTNVNTNRRDAADRERTSSEESPHAAALNVMEDAIINLTSGFIAYSLAIDHFMPNRLEEIADANARQCPKSN